MKVNLIDLNIGDWFIINNPMGSDHKLRVVNKEKINDTKYVVFCFGLTFMVSEYFYNNILVTKIEDSSVEEKIYQSTFEK